MKRDHNADLALCEAASVGPWEKVDVVEEGYETVYSTVNSSYEQICCYATLNNAAFIAAARDALPHWIFRAVEAETEIERLRRELMENGK
jgi:hypothetical protein